MSTLKLKKLEEYLQGVDPFEKPKILLEQYITPSHIASCMIHTVQTKYEDLEGKIVADLGAGSGMLSVGALLMGAQHVVAFEIDSDAITVSHQIRSPSGHNLILLFFTSPQDFQTNLEEMDIDSQIDIVQSDISSWDGDSGFEKMFDTVLMNPPFGTKKNAGLDVKFLENGIKLARNAVYSLHKSSTRDYIKKKGLDMKTKPEVVAQLRYNIDASYKFHKKQSVDVEVDFWRFEIQ